VTDGPSIDEYDLSPLKDTEATVYCCSLACLYVPRIDYYVIHDWEGLETGEFMNVPPCKVLIYNQKCYDLSVANEEFMYEHEVIFDTDGHLHYNYTKLKKIYFLGEDGYCLYDGTPRRQELEYSKRSRYKAFKAPPDHAKLCKQQKFLRYHPENNQLGGYRYMWFRIKHHIEKLAYLNSQGCEAYTLCVDSIFPYEVPQAVLNQPYGKIFRSGNALVFKIIPDNSKTDAWQKLTIENCVNYCIQYRKKFPNVPVFVLTNEPECGTLEQHDIRVGKLEDKVYGHHFDSISERVLYFNERAKKVSNGSKI